MTTVVNIKSGDTYDVYIGRAGKGQPGYFGNPVHFDFACPICGAVHVDTPLGREEVLACYKKYFWKRIHTDAAFRKQVASLKGKRLGCFCKPKLCHGDVIKAWLDAGCPV